MNFLNMNDEQINLIRKYLSIEDLDDLISKEKKHLHKDIRRGIISLILTLVGSYLYSYILAFNSQDIGSLLFGFMSLIFIITIILVIVRIIGIIKEDMTMLKMLNKANLFIEYAEIDVLHYKYGIGNFMNKYNNEKAGLIFYIEHKDKIKPLYIEWIPGEVNDKLMLNFGDKLARDRLEKEIKNQRNEILNYRFNPEDNK